MNKLEVSHYFEKTFPFLSCTDEVGDILASFHDEDIYRLSPEEGLDEFDIIEAPQTENNVFFLETHIENFRALLVNFSDMLHTFPAFTEGLKFGLLDYYAITKGLLKYAVYESALSEVSNERLNLKIALVLVTGLVSKETKAKHDIYRDLQVDIKLYGLDLIISDIANCHLLIEACKKYGRDLLSVIRTFHKDYYPVFMEGKKEICYLITKEEEDDNIKNT